MEIYYSLEEIAQQSRRSVATVGNFDGVHLAHQELLRRVQERARQENAASVAVTFDPHPSKVLAPQKAPSLLTPLSVKQELLAKSGIDRLLILPFTRDFSLWSPEQFVQELLVNTLQATAVVVGESFRFGHRQTGTPAVLQELGQRWNFQTEVLPRICVRKLVVSSSQIRRLLDEGKISLANRLLGRPFSIRNRVEPGRGIGRSQTVPTLNLAPYAERLPAAGVYITWTRFPAQSDDKKGVEPQGAEPPARQFRSVTNVGHKPTFGEHELGVETHLLEPWEGEPPNNLEVSFLFRLRNERKFESAEELKQQIMKDIRGAEAYFRRLERFRVSIMLHE
ncbi:MAG: riboflavin biosynthesis protein RibF [Acidobacteria bacterium RIFCSPLOWO2_12_FULL_59_11]|nr:MAG: riboflavin biosynthesis protein RibF [Acidobacteria bacterium RIFCSPLOWO2_12_FULL_59_11]